MTKAAVYPNKSTSLDDKKLDLLRNELGENRIKLEESLHYHTGSQLDLPAEAFYIATNQLELQRALDTALELGISFKVLGYDTIEAPKRAKKIDGLVIKNRTHQIKISAIKGKFVIGSMGIDQVSLEIDSGVCLKELQDYFEKSKLVQPVFASVEKFTIGEVLSTEFGIQGMIEHIKVWEKGVIEEVNILEFNPKKQVVLSVVVRVKSIQML
jgi:hypothetical protein